MKNLRTYLISTFQKKCNYFCPIWTILAGKRTVSKVRRSEYISYLTQTMSCTCKKLLGPEVLSYVVIGHKGHFRKKPDPYFQVLLLFGHHTHIFETNGFDF